MVDYPFTIDQHANLAIDLEGQLAEIARQFLGDDLLRWHLATIDMLQPMNLIGLQARQVTVYPLNRRSPLGQWSGVIAVSRETGRRHTGCGVQRVGTTGTY